MVAINSSRTWEASPSANGRIVISACNFAFRTRFSHSPDRQEQRAGITQRLGPGRAEYIVNTVTPLDDFSVAEFASGGVSHRVYRKGAGPDVLLIHELPGMTPQFIGLARTIAEAGFTVHLPLFFGERVKGTRFCSWPDSASAASSASSPSAAEARSSTEGTPENGEAVEVVLRSRCIEMGCCASSDRRDHPQRRGREGYRRSRPSHACSRLGSPGDEGRARRPEPPRQRRRRPVGR